LSSAAGSHGRSRFRSGKGRLAPPSPATPIAIGRDVSAVWGIDHDDVKIRCPGAFPDASAVQLTVETIRAARVREVLAADHESLIMSLNVARFGSNETVLGFRRGKDARSLPPKRWRRLSTMVAAHRTSARTLHTNPTPSSFTRGGGGGGVVDRLRQLGHRVIGVGVGSKSGGLTSGFIGDKRGVPVRG